VTPVRTTMKPYKVLPSPNAETQAYWDGARNNELVIQQCQDCQALIHPPAYFCTRCATIIPHLGHTTVSGKGSLYSFALHYDNQIKGFEDKTPYILALIELDEQAGLTVYGNVLNAAYEELRLGMPMEAIWEETDNPDIKIMQWQPVR
jgi:uncharacterized protein